MVYRCNFVRAIAAAPRLPFFHFALVYLLGSQCILFLTYRSAVICIIHSFIHYSSRQSFIQSHVYSAPFSVRYFSSFSFSRVSFFLSSFLFFLLFIIPSFTFPFVSALDCSLVRPFLPQHSSFVDDHSYRCCTQPFALLQLHPHSSTSS